MTIKKIILVLCLIPLFSYSNSKSIDFGKLSIYKNRRAKYPVGINVHAFGPGGVSGLSVDWFIVPKINFEFGAGLNDLKTFRPSYFAGGKYHFFGNTISNTTFYLGLFDKLTVDSEVNFDNTLYVPFGLQRIKKSKLTWNIEVAYTYNLLSYKSQVWGAFKLGYRFNRFDKKKKKPNK